MLFVTILEGLFIYLFFIQINPLQQWPLGGIKTSEREKKKKRKENKKKLLLYYMKFAYS